jgi:hypothetical protein
MEAQVATEFSLFAYYTFGEPDIRFICSRQYVIPGNHVIHSIVREPELRIYSSDHQAILPHVGSCSDKQIKLFKSHMQPDPDSVVKLFPFWALKKMNTHINNQYATKISLELYERIMNAVLVYLGGSFMTRPDFPTLYEERYTKALEKLESTEVIGEDC